MDKEYHYIIRADASTQIGIGHVMRCLTLAEKLTQQGARVLFICRELIGHLCDFIEAKGFEVIRLPAPLSMPESKESDAEYAHWLGIDWQQELAESTAILAQSDEPLEWLIVDHYALDSRWEMAMRPYVKKILVIDDLANRPHDCDILLDQNFYEHSETRYTGLVPPTGQQLLGPQYALLRPEFRQQRNVLRERDGKVRRILVFFGGSDPTNETLKTLQAIRLLDYTDLAVDVVVGASNLRHEEINTFCKLLPNTKYHHQIANMAELMAQADLAIGAGGSTTWERCCLGLPTLTIVTAQNQQALSLALANQGKLLYLGNCETVTVESIRCATYTLLKLPEWLKFLAQTSQELVDGRGVERVVQYLVVLYK